VTEVPGEQSRGERERMAGDEKTAMSAQEIGSIARQYISELTSKETVGATAVEPVEDGWLVGVEVIEERRIPTSADMLALYEVELDLDGELLAYRRTRRYARGSTINGNEGS
jgi:hypothetical protein